MTNLIFLLIGAVVASVLAFLLYRARERITTLRSQVGERVTAQRARITRGAEARYLEALIDLANDQHIAAHLAPLEALAVEPRFLRWLPPSAAAPSSTERSEDQEAFINPLDLIPRVYDRPELSGPYQLEGVPLTHLLVGEGGVAVLGTPGSGRSVALALLAIRVASGEDILDAPRLPVLFHLADADLNPKVLGRRADPGEILLDAIRRRMKSAPLGPVSNALMSGDCLLLADGWDELPDEQGRRAAAWLQGLQEAYPGNKLVVSGPAQGYGALLVLGLSLVYMMPWGDPQFALLAHLWADSWATMMGTLHEPAAPPGENLIQRAATGNRGRPPMDAVMKTWAIYAGDARTAGRRGWYDAYITRMNPVPDTTGALQRIANAALQASNEIGLSVEEASDYIDAALGSTEKIGMDTTDYLVEITQKLRLMVERAERRLTFRHPLITASLAAEADSEAESALPFRAVEDDIGGQVGLYLRQDDDLLRDNLVTLTGWVVDADPEAAWRGALLRRLAQVLLQPNQYPLVRERMLAALIASRDPGVGFVFRQGLKSSDALGRMLCAFGLGALGDPNIVVDLSEGLADPDQNVRIATVLALGAIGTKAAVGYLIEALLTGSEPVRRAAAEALATNPGGEGHEILQEALSEESPEARRAAVYGLRRVGEPWVMDLLADVAREDAHWYVRTAANEAYEALQQSRDVETPDAFLEPSQIEWLVAWAGIQGQEIPPGSEGIEFMIRALQEGEEAIRLAAAQALGQMGQAESIKPLYTALQDSSPEVRDVAYRALGQIQAALGKPLPAV